MELLWAFRQSFVGASSSIDSTSQVCFHLLFLRQCCFFRFYLWSIPIFCSLCHVWPL